MNAISTHAALSSRTVQLRPLLPSDDAWVYALLCGPAGERWRYRGRTPSPEAAAADLWRNVYAQFVVTDRSTGQPAGLVAFYNVAVDAGRAHAHAIAEPDAALLVTEGFGLLCSWGFDHLGWQRILLEVPEFNIEQFSSLGDAAVVEGRLRNYELWQGRYWDLFILSITAESFQRRLGSLLAQRRGPSPVGGHHGEEQLAALVRELWPLDSLGAVEVVCAAEEFIGAAVEQCVVTGIDADTADEYTQALLRELYQLMPAAAR